MVPLSVQPEEYIKLDTSYHMLNICVKAMTTIHYLLGSVNMAWPLSHMDLDIMYERTLEQIQQPKDLVLSLEIGQVT